MLTEPPIITDDPTIVNNHYYNTRPTWCDWAEVKRWYPRLSKARLNKFEKDSNVRVVRGDTQQSAVEYCLSDIDNVYDCISRGKPLERA